MNIIYKAYKMEYDEKVVSAECILYIKFSS